jgi:hypothetical protein
LLGKNPGDGCASAFFSTSRARRSSGAEEERRATESNRITHKARNLPLLLPLYLFLLSFTDSTDAAVIGLSNVAIRTIIHGPTSDTKLGLTMRPTKVLHLLNKTVQPTPRGEATPPRRRQWSRRRRRPPRPPSASSPAHLLPNPPPLPPPTTASSPSASWAPPGAPASPTGSSTPTSSHPGAPRGASPGASGTTATGTGGWCSCTSRRWMTPKGIQDLPSSRTCSSCSRSARPDSYSAFSLLLLDFIYCMC